MPLTHTLHCSRHLNNTRPFQPLFTTHKQVSYKQTLPHILTRPQTARMCRITIAPLRSERKHTHERPTIQQDPSAAYPPTTHNATPTHRHTMYAPRTATTPAGVFLSPASAALSHSHSHSTSSSSSSSSLSAIPSIDQEFQNYYAILRLDHWATSEEIKDAYRKLRAEYFHTDAGKYRALQEAYAVLVDRNARWNYDCVYRERIGVPQPPLPHTHSGSLRMQKGGFVKQAQEMMVVEVKKKEEEVKRKNDPNWVLKHHKQVFKPVLGTRPYQSFVPILAVYEGRQAHPTLKCQRPRYVGSMAKNARP
ncbi:hypothetical protein BU26DRAFT_575424 [Trematosphaeria pertusa]|uniref:J domain-containing protein n=1 Tax=Trematosphaeria pertusa TaxID=390896 RepID=A0A6A6J471_9PLEO|nr:uncharacterized protein BU26DRAFT_575424 [Trematosphaeria pertusa]KAF2257012.1 hypothetical protein BU26DRAFT_575424 [Trematosphaeria pertusa]